MLRKKPFFFGNVNSYFYSPLLAIKLLSLRSVLLGCIRGSSLEFVRLDVVPDLTQEDINDICGHEHDEARQHITNNYYLNVLDGSATENSCLKGNQ